MQRRRRSRARSRGAIVEAREVDGIWRAMDACAAPLLPSTAMTITTVPIKARIIEWNAADAIGTLETADGESVRFGGTACVGFEPAVGIDCWIVAVKSDPLRHGRSRAAMINLTGAIEPTRRESAERFVEVQEDAADPRRARRASSKRDAFWEEVPRTPGGEIDWPSEPSARAALADEILGAKWIGACESALDSALDLVSGIAPRPRDSEFERLRPRAEVLRTLDAEQRQAVAAVMTELARATLYWGMVKIDRLPSATVSLRIDPLDADGNSVGAVDVRDLSSRFHEWIERFADTLGDE